MPQLGASAFFMVLHAALFMPIALFPWEPDLDASDPTAVIGEIDIPQSIAEMREHWTKFPMISTPDDICWIWSKRASSTSIVASLYRLAVVPFHLVQQWDRNVA